MKQRFYFEKLKIPENNLDTLSKQTGAQPEIFQDRGGFVELAQLDKLFVKNRRKKGPAGKNFGAFSPRHS